MKKLIFSVLVSAALIGGGCKSAKDAQQSKETTTERTKSGMNKTQKGAAVGTAAGAVVGGIIGSKSKNTAIGAILGAVVGGSVGAVIGSRMDKQAEKMQQALGDDATVERVGEGIQVTFNSQLLFDYNKHYLKEVNKEDLRRLSESLKQVPDTDLLIVGHTDDVGSDKFNRKLSEKRANSIYAYLTSLGVSPSRLKTMGAGESQPMADNTSDAGRQQNRRVEIAIYANERMKADAKSEVSGE